MIKNINCLQLRINENEKHSSIAYVCIGRGICVPNKSELNLSYVYGINIKHLYMLNCDGTYSNGWVGSVENEFYYITRNFYNENIMKTFTVQDAIKKAESFMGK